MALINSQSVSIPNFPTAYLRGGFTNIWILTTGWWKDEYTWVDSEVWKDGESGNIVEILDSTVSTFWKNTGVFFSNIWDGITNFFGNIFR